LTDHGCVPSLGTSNSYAANGMTSSETRLAGSSPLQISTSVLVDSNQDKSSPVQVPYGISTSKSRQSGPLLRPNYASTIDENRLRIEPYDERQPNMVSGRRSNNIYSNPFLRHLEAGQQAPNLNNYPTGLQGTYSPSMTSNQGSNFSFPANLPDQVSLHRSDLSRYFGAGHGITSFDSSHQTLITAPDRGTPPEDLEDTESTFRAMSD
jgi:hypothetical protein